MAFKLSQLKEINKIYDEFVEIQIDVPTEEGIVQETIKLYPAFKPEKIRDLVEEMTEFYKAADKEKIKIEDKEMDDIVGYFIFRHFTDITMTKSKKAKILHEEYKLLINSSLYKQIGKLIPEQSIQSVYEYIQEVIEASVKIEKQLRQQQKEIKNLKLENKEVIDMVNNAK